MPGGRSSAYRGEQWMSTGEPMLKRGANSDVDTQWDELVSMVERHSGVVFAGPHLETFRARVTEHMQARRIRDAAELVRILGSSSAEYESLLDHLLASPCDFLRLPQVFHAFQQRILPEMHMKKFWDNPRSLRVW